MPELGKATYVIEIDERKFKRGLNDAKKTTRKFTSDQDRELAKMARAWDGATLSVTKTSDSMDKNSRSADRNRHSLRNLGGDAIKLNQALGLVGKTIAAMKIPAFSAAIGVAIKAVNALAGGAVALLGALAPLTGLLAALPALVSTAAQAMGTLALAFSPVLGVVKEMASAHESAAAGAATNATATRSAARSIQQSERQLSQAHREVTLAVKGMTAARLEARRALQELRLESEGAALGEKRAIESVQEARQALRKASFEGKSKQEITSLSLAVEEAELGLKESRLSNKRTQEELQKTEAKGVGKSEQVVAAKERVRRAEQSVLDVSNSLKDQLEAQKNAAGGASTATNKLANNMAKLSPQAQKFAKFIYGLQGKLRGLQAAAGKKMFPGMEAGIKSALKNMPTLERALERTGGAIGRVSEKAGDLVGSKGFGDRLQKITANNAVTIERLGASGLSLADALSHVMVAARPLVNWLTKGVEQFSAWIDKAAAAGQQTGKLGEFFDKTKQTLRVVGGALLNFGEALYNIGKQGAPLGRTILKSLDDTAVHFREWTESAKGKNTIAEYFREIKPPLWEMGRLVRDVTKDFFKIGKSSGLYETLHSLRTTVLPVLSKFIESMTNAFGPVLMELLTAVAPLAETIAGTSGPLIVMLKVLQKMAEVANWVLTASPVLKAAVVTMLGATAIFKGVKLAGTVSGIGRLVDAWKTVKDVAIGAKAAEEAAASPGILSSLKSNGGVLGALKGMLKKSPTAATTVAPKGMLSGAEVSGIMGAAPAAAEAAAAVPPAAPWIALGAAIVAAGVGVWQLYEHSKTFREMVKPVVNAAVEGWEEIKKAFEPVTEAVKEVAHSFSGNGELAKNVKQLWSQVKGPLEAVLNVVRVVLVAGIAGAFKQIAGTIRGMAKVFSGEIQIITGIVEVITGILTGHFGKAWEGIKNIFRGGLKMLVGMLDIFKAPIEGAITAIGTAMGDLFGGAWEKAEEIVVGGINKVIDVINFMIRLVNKLPFIELGEIGHVGGSSDVSSAPRRQAGTRGAQGGEAKHHGAAEGGHVETWAHMAGGGKVAKGKPTGDSVPTVLERNEYVLNKKAVERVGVRNLDRLNFGAASRFAGSSPTGSAGMDIGGTIGAIGGALGDVGSTALEIGTAPIRVPAELGLELAGKGAKEAAKLAIGALPEFGEGFFGKIGGYVKEELSNWVTGEAGKASKKESAGGSIADAGDLQQFNRTYPEHMLTNTAGKARFSEKLVAHIAAWAGLPGRTFGQVAHGESDFYPGVYGIDPSGETEGLGLWQITTGFNDEKIAKWGGRKQMFNPLKNAKAAKEVYDEAGLGAWYGTKFVTGMAAGGEAIAAAEGKRRGRGYHGLPLGYAPPDRGASRGELEALHALGVRGFAAGGQVTWQESDTPIGKMLRRARELNGTPYLYGGGHGGFQANPANLDCSAAVSEVLHAGGLLNEMMASTALESWGSAGPGTKMTVYANPEHAWMEILGHPWGTSVGDNGAGGTGYHPQPEASYKAGFVKRHSPAADASALRRATTGTAAPAGKAPGEISTPNVPKIPATVKGRAPAHGTAGGGVAAPTNYNVQTTQLKFGALPDTVAKCRAEIRQRQRELAEYNAAIRAEKDKDVKEALRKNAGLLRERLLQLKQKITELRIGEKAGRRVAGIKSQALFEAFTGPGGLFEKSEAGYNEAEELAQQVLSQEPVMPEEATKSWIEQTYGPYVEGAGPHQETGAFSSVLGTEAAWRNNILSAEGVAQGKIGDWEGGAAKAIEHVHGAKARERAVEKRIAEIMSFKGSKPNAWDKWKGDLPGLRSELAILPQRVKAFEGERDAYREDINQTRGTTLPEWEQQLSSIQGLGKSHEKMGSLPGSPEVGGFGGMIWTTQSQLQELGLKVGAAEANLPKAEDPAKKLAEEQTEAMEAVAKELNEEEVKRAKVTNLLAPVFSDFFAHVPKYGGIFHSGGVVPGRQGEERTIVAEAGEIVAQPDNMAAEGGAGDRPQPVVIVEDGAVNADRIKHIWSDEMEKRVSTSRRRIGG